MKNARRIATVAAASAAVFAMAAAPAQAQGIADVPEGSLGSLSVEQGGPLPTSSQMVSSIVLLPVMGSYMAECQIREWMGEEFPCIF